jgi:hypothetical protein
MSDDDTVWQHPTDDDHEPRHGLGSAVDDAAPTAELAPVPPAPEDEHLDLLEDPFSDDLSRRLQSAAPLKLANRATYVLVAIVIGVAGFVGGAQVQKSYGASSSASGNRPGGNFPTALPSGFAGFGNRGGGAGPGGAGTGGAGGRGGISGTVKLVDGTTVYVVEADGTVVTVKTSDQTTVEVPGALKDLAAGQSVTVQGQNDNGTVTATNIARTK